MQHILFVYNRNIPNILPYIITFTLVRKNTRIDNETNYIPAEEPEKNTEPLLGKQASANNKKNTS